MFDKKDICLVDGVSNSYDVYKLQLVPSDLYGKMMDIIDDYNLSQEVEKRLNDGEKPIRVDIDDLLS